MLSIISVFTNSYHPNLPIQASGRLYRVAHPLLVINYERQCRFMNNQRLQMICPNTKKRNVRVYNGLNHGAPLPSDPSPHSWKLWILGALISIVLPSWRANFFPLMLFKGKVESMIDTAEEVADIVEKVVEEVEKVAEEVADHLPEGGKLKQTVTLIEFVAKETAMDAHIVGEIIDKVEEVEQEVKALIDPLIGQNQANNGINKEEQSLS